MRATRMAAASPLSTPRVSAWLLLLPGNTQRRAAPVPALLITAGASQELQRKVSTRGTGNKGGECVASRLILAELFSARGVPRSELAGNQTSFLRSAQTPGLAPLVSAVIPASS